jgi:hypothetical protein
LKNELISRGWNTLDGSHLSRKFALSNGFSFDGSIGWRIGILGRLEKMAVERRDSTSA